MEAPEKCVHLVRGSDQLLTSVWREQFADVRHFQDLMGWAPYGTEQAVSPPANPVYYYFPSFTPPLPQLYLRCIISYLFRPSARRLSPVVLQIAASPSRRTVSILLNRTVPNLLSDNRTCSSELFFPPNDPSVCFQNTAQKFLHTDVTPTPSWSYSGYQVPNNAELHSTVGTAPNGYATTDSYVMSEYSAGKVGGVNTFIGNSITP